MTQPRFGLALGGGGARGFAHVGVLQRLEEVGIKPQIITGTSMGALVAAVYTRTGNSADTLNELNAMVESESFHHLGLHLINVKRRGGDSFWHQVSSAMKDRIVINLAHSKPGLVQQERVEEAIGLVIKADIWHNQEVKLGIVATDLYTGEDVYFSEGPLLPAVMASIAIPGFLPPVQIGDRVLVDGGVSQQVPIRMARELGADFILAVDVGQDIHPIADLDNAMAIMTQSENIRACHYRDMLNKEADVVLAAEMPGVHWSAYDQREAFIALGKKIFDERRVTIENAWYQKRNPLRGWLKNLITNG
jgi:NTE family protein